MPPPMRLLPARTPRTPTKDAPAGDSAMPTLTVAAWSAAAAIAAAAALLVARRGLLQRGATATARGGRPWAPRADPSGPERAAAAGDPIPNPVQPPHVPARELSEYW